MDTLSILEVIIGSILTIIASYFAKKKVIKEREKKRT